MGCAALFLALLLQTPSPPPVREAPPLRVMSFNIRFDTEADGPNAWRHRRDAAASMIRFHRADLAGLQEAMRSQILDLEARLPGYAWLGVGRDDGKAAGEHCPVFYRKERLRPLESGTFWLSPTPEKPGSRGWDAALPRIATWARFEDLASGVTFLFLDTHLDHRGATARARSAALILERARTLAAGSAVLLAGDLNCNDSSPPYRLLTGGAPGAPPPPRSDTFALEDVRSLSRTPPHGPSATYHRFLGTPDPDKGTIDHLLVRGAGKGAGVGGGLEVLRYGVLSDRFDGGYPSDHFPVLAEIVLR